MRLLLMGWIMEGIRIVGVDGRPLVSQRTGVAVGEWFLISLWCMVVHNPLQKTEDFSCP
jgi:hypothetical protein